jgi:VWFA-related protein
MNGNSRAKFLLSATILFFAQLPARSQDVPTFSSNVKVVNLLASVRDKHGQIINTLTKDDFILAEDGRPQTIRYFARETDLPLTIGLLVDTSLSQRNVLENERTASLRFLNEVLRIDKDKAFVIHFDHQVELLQDLTYSLQKLQTALDSVDLPAQSQGGSGSGRRGGGFGGGGTLLYDAVFLASDELMKPQEGRKAVIILSDGVDEGSKLNVARAIESAQRSNTIVYSILFADKDRSSGGGFSFPGGGMGGRGGGGGMGRRGGGGGPGGGGPGGGGPGGGGYPQRSHADGKKILQQIAKETGGSFFEVSKKEPIEKIYASIQEELRSQYNLGYTPDGAQPGEGLHKIALTTKQKDLTVQTRDSYYAKN